MALTLFFFYTMPFGSVGAQFSQMEKATPIEKVIILKEAGGRGKTPTLHILIDLLVSKGATCIYDEGYTSYTSRLLRDTGLSRLWECRHNHLR